MKKLRTEVQYRLLGNGWCTRPAELDCSFESICENCTHFTTNKTFQPVLIKQRDPAKRNGQTGRAQRFTTLVEKSPMKPLDKITYISPVMRASVDTVAAAGRRTTGDPIVRRFGCLTPGSRICTYPSPCIRSSSSWRPNGAG